MNLIRGFVAAWRFMVAPGGLLSDHELWILSERVSGGIVVSQIGEGLGRKSHNATKSHLRSALNNTGAQKKALLWYQIWMCSVAVVSPVASAMHDRSVARSSTQELRGKHSSPRP
jgi:hypothetical protein